LALGGAQVKHATTASGTQTHQINESARLSMPSVLQDSGSFDHGLHFIDSPKNGGNRKPNGTGEEIFMFRQMWFRN